MRGACAYTLTIHQVGGYLGGFMYNAIPAVVEGKSVLINKVGLLDQPLALDLLNNLLDIAYAQGKIDGMDSARKSIEVAL